MASDGGADRRRRGVLLVIPAALGTLFVVVRAATWGDGKGDDGDQPQARVTTSAPSIANPDPFDADAFRQSEHVAIVAPVDTDRDEAARLRVVRVLIGETGDLRPGSEIVVTLRPHASVPDVPGGAAVALARTADGYELVTAAVSARTGERVLAGLEPDDPTPTRDQVAAQYEAADAVAVVSWQPIGGTDGAQADARVLATLKGELPDRIRLTRPDRDDPGGAWRFDEAPGLSSGVVFLDEADGSWIVTNPARPGLTAESDVVAATGG